MRVKLSWIRVAAPPVVLAVLLAFAFSRWFYWYPSFLQPNRTEASVWQNGSWKRLPDSQDALQQIRVSRSSVVWALMWRHGVGAEVARLDGTTWQMHHASGLEGNLVLDGEELWGNSVDGLLHWDGSNWQTLAAVKDLTGIVAGSGQVWGITGSGDLRHFDGKEWSSTKLPMQISEETELARSGDGTLWIVDNGVWRGDGNAWQRAGEVENASLVGAASDGVWLWGDRKLIKLSPDGTSREFARAAMGLGPREWANDVTEWGGHTYISTTAGVLDFDGTQWRKLPQTPGGVVSILSVAAAGEGTVYAVGSIPNPMGRRLQMVARFVPLALMLGILGCVVWLVRRYKQNQLEQHQKLQQAVAHATGAVPDEFTRDERLLARQSSWGSATVAVGVVIGAMVGYWTLRIFRPGTPSWMFLAIALGLHLLAMMWQTLTRREAKPWDPIEPGGKGFDWGPTKRALPASLVVFLLMNIGHFPSWMGDPALWVLYGLAAFFAVKLIEQKLLQMAINRGDYEDALELIRRFHFYSPEGGTALLPRGHMLLLAARYREAEMVLRRAIAELRVGAAQGYALEFLGDALMEQGREEEARRAYEAAVKAAPKFRRMYRGMAELELRNGGDPARALETIEKIQGTARDDYQSLRAWALAEMGHGAESEEAAAKAIRSTNPNSKPDLAATWRRLGLAMRALNREREALDYFQKAAAIDPHGRWGSLARAAAAQRRQIPIN